MTERCCWKLCCCCCEDSCASLADANTSSTATSINAPLLQNKEFDSSESSADSLLGSQVYFRSVRKAFTQHFTEDSEVYQTWQSMSWPDIISATVRMSAYREKRIKNGNVELPPAVQLTNVEQPLVCSDLLHWAEFADMAYVGTEDELRAKLRNINHQLICLEARAGLMEPAHFLAMDLTRKTAVVGIKGTSSSNDWLTNLFIAKEELKVNDGREDEDRDFGIHAGVLHGARFVLSRIGVVLQRAFYDAGFDIVVVGHSLGAGVAAAFAMLLKEEFQLERVKSYCFAPPPAFSSFLSHRSRSYIYSVVNCDDAIPRTGVAQLKSLAMSIKAVVDLKNTLGGSWDKVEAELDEMVWSDLIGKFAQGKAEKNFDTYVPGRVLFLYEFQKEKVGYREIHSDAHTLRIAIVSPNMVADHSMVSYRARLHACAVHVV